jgi:hypothetical protein
MDSTLADWILNGLPDEASASNVAAPSIWFQEQRPHASDETLGTDDTTESSPAHGGIFMEMSPDMPASMQYRLCDALCDDAFKTPAFPLTQVVNAIVAAATTALTPNMTRASVGGYWTTLLVAVQTIAARLRLPLTVALEDIDVDTGATVDIALTCGTDHRFCIGIKTVLDVEFRKCLGGPVSANGRLATTNLPAGAEAAFQTAPCKEQSLVEKVRDPQHPLLSPLS